MRAGLFAATLFLTAACGGDDDGTPEPLDCPEQADGTCAPGAPDGCWTWSAARVRPDAGCVEGRFSTCTSGGVDAGSAITCWRVVYPDGGTAQYQTTNTSSRRFPSDWSVTFDDDDTCESAELHCSP